MTPFTKTLASSLLASMFIVSAPVFADDIYLEPSDYEDVIADVERDDSDIERSIVVTAKQGQPIFVRIDEDGEMKKFEFSEKELSDHKAIERKLKGLSSQTFIKVRKTLEAVDRGMQKLFVLDNQSQITVEFDGDEMDTDLDFDFDFSKLEGLKALKNIGDMDNLTALQQLGELRELKVLEQLMSKEHATAIRQRVRHEHDSEEHERAMERQERAMERQHRTHDIKMQRAERAVRAASDRKNELIHKHKQNMIIIDGQDSHIISGADDHTSANREIEIRRFKLDDDNVVLKGHVDAILKLISHGEFTPDELDKLQQMLDSKR